MPLAANRTDRTDENRTGPAEAFEPTAPKRLGRYEIVEELGRGAMGVVYKARDPVLDRVVAIKTISLELPKSERAEYEARFYQEARAAGRLNHPNIVTIYDIGRTERLAYMAMEFLEGEELRAVLTPGSPIPIHQAIDITVQVAEGLGYAHENRVIHRDIKPSNIMVVRDGLVKIMDFGIARLHESEVKTMTGLIMGSPKYMSPEQVTGARPDQRSDVFSMGVMLYEILSGSSPFSGESIHSIMYQIIHFAPPPPSQVNRHVPEMLDLIVAKALSKKIDERYATAREMAHDLRLCKDLMPSVIADVEHTQPLLPVPSDLGVSTGSEKVVSFKRQIPDSWDDVEDIDPQPARKAYGVSKAFDSSEATQRIAAYSPKTPKTPQAPKPDKPISAPRAKAEKRPQASNARATSPAAQPVSGFNLKQEFLRLAKSRWIWVVATFALAGSLLTLVLSQ